LASCVPLTDFLLSYSEIIQYLKPSLTTIQNNSKNNKWTPIFFWLFDETYGFVLGTPNCRMKRRFSHSKTNPESNPKKEKNWTGFYFKYPNSKLSMCICHNQCHHHTQCSHWFFIKQYKIWEQLARTDPIPRPYSQNCLLTKGFLGILS